LRDRAHDVVGVYCPPDVAPGKIDPVKARAQVLGIPVRQHASLKGTTVQQEFASLTADLGVMAYVTQIVPAAIIDTPRLGSICFHPSLLPRYRGGSAIPWQIIKGETRTGVSAFWADAGIDTGPILLQKEAVIAADDTAASLYYQTLFPLGVEVVLSSVDLIAAGKAPRVTQDEALSSYDPLCRDEHAKINWARPVGEVYNLIRGCDPQPGAFVVRDGQNVRCYDARRDERGDLPPGVVGEVDEKGIRVGCQGGSIRVARLRIGDKKLAARDAAETLGLRIGQRF
jgi:methionyl-tRNA formyltransferase